MKHIHARFLFVQDLVFWKLLKLTAVKTDMNPSDIGTKAGKIAMLQAARNAGNGMRALGMKSLQLNAWQHLLWKSLFRQKI